MAAPAVKAAPEPAKAEPRKVIVGLPSNAQVTQKRRRGKKGGGSISALGLDNTAADALPLEEPAPAVSNAAETLLVPVEVLSHETKQIVTEEELEKELEEEKRFVPVSILQKRIKAHNKKLQRIAAYEAQPEKLNPDQQKAVASKPAIEQAIKELQDLVAVFQAEEVEEEKRLQRKEAAAARRNHAEIRAAIDAQENEARDHLEILLQFLHLRSLFAPSQTGFAPQSVPPTVAKATPQEFAAVMSLYDSLANGPLAGGGDDALHRIQQLCRGTADDVIEGVTYARIRHMIIDLTAPPHESEVEDDNLTSAQIDDVLQESAVVNGVSNTQQPPAGISFMQASDIAPEASLSGDTGVSTPSADPFSKAGPAEPVIPPVPAAFDAPTTNWADDVDQAVNASTATSPRSHPPRQRTQSIRAPPPKFSDGTFPHANAGGPPNGNFRGGYRGRGGGGGGGGGGRGGRGGPRPDRADGEVRRDRPEGERQERGGRGRGGPGRSRGDWRGRGRGAPVGRPPSQPAAVDGVAAQS